ncbi:hypothetical protein EDB19DRAFT_1386390 [Suillus lakei]|nr:hypothetical protein EDB19DRAFT_1386390 [Suillus lakei]
MRHLHCCHHHVVWIRKPDWHVTVSMEYCSIDSLVDRQPLMSCSKMMTAFDLELCLYIMTDIRDFEDDLKAGVPTILVLLGSIRKTKVILTACHMLVMLAFFENSYIMGSCLFVAALVWTLAQKGFLLSSHSQSLFIIWYLLTRRT